MTEKQIDLLKVISWNGRLTRIGFSTWRLSRDGGKAEERVHYKVAERLKQLDYIELAGDWWGTDLFRVTDKGRAALSALGIEA